MAQRRIVIIARSDGTVDRYPLKPAVEMHFERAYKVGINKMAEGAEGATNVYRLAWEVDRSQGGTIPDFVSWANDIDAVEIETEDIVPTVPVQPVTTSPASPSVSE